MMHTKKCSRCGRSVTEIKTDGIDLYLKGEKMPPELVKAWFPCPHCKGVVEWKRKREKVKCE